jgi:hypothetical protein
MTNKKATTKSEQQIPLGDDKKATTKTSAKAEADPLRG